MEIVAHSLWAAAAALATKRTTRIRLRHGWTVWWAAFPDVLAFGPATVAGLVLMLVRGRDAVSPGAPHVHFALSLYPAGHSLIVFAVVFAGVTFVTRRVFFELLGWLLHILIDIPTHSLSYYATRFLWPVSDFCVDGIAWWTPWFLGTTYGALAAVYAVQWKKGWLGRPARHARVRHGH